VRGKAKGGEGGKGIATGAKGGKGGKGIARGAKGGGRQGCRGR